MLNQDFKELIQSENCYASRVEIEIGNVTASFIDLENLKKNKQAVGLQQDLADLENLK